MATGKVPVPMIYKFGNQWRYHADCEKSHLVTIPNIQHGHGMALDRLGVDGLNPIEYDLRIPRRTVWVAVCETTSFWNVYAANRGGASYNVIARFASLSEAVRYAQGFILKEIEANAPAQPVVNLQDLPATYGNW